MLVAKVDLDHQVEVPQVVIRGRGRVRAHHQLTLVLCVTTGSIQYFHLAIFLLALCSTDMLREEDALSHKLPQSGHTPLSNQIVCW